MLADNSQISKQNGIFTLILQKHKIVLLLLTFFIQIIMSLFGLNKTLQQSNLVCILYNIK
jgi:hypothetical protein